MMYDFFSDNNILFNMKIYNFQVLHDTFNIIDSNSGMSCCIQLASESICSTNIEGNNKFNYIKMQKCADAIIIRKNKNNNLDLHILELKKDIHDKDLDKLYFQFLGAYIRVMNILIAYAKVDNINFHLIYDKKIDTSNVNQIKSTNQKKNISYDRILFNVNKIKNKYVFEIFPFNSDTLDIKKYNLSNKANIII